MSQRGIKFDKSSKVQQNFKEETQISKIVARFSRGILPAGNSRPMYLDLYNAPSFHKAQNMVIEIHQRFMSLPAKVRKQFANNPHNMLEFIGDEKNREKARELGLLKPLEPTPLEKEIERQKIKDEAREKRGKAPLATPDKGKKEE